MEKLLFILRLLNQVGRTDTIIDSFAHLLASNAEENIVKYLQDYKEENMRTFFLPEKLGTQYMAESAFYGANRSGISNKKLPLTNEQDISKDIDAIIEKAAKSNAMIAGDVIEIVNKMEASRKPEKEEKEEVEETDDDEKVIRIYGANSSRYKRHRYSKVRHISFGSLSRPTGNFSQFNTVLWLDDRLRVQIRLLYNKVDDLWQASSSLLKQNPYYSNFSKPVEEEACTPVRYCHSTDLGQEIKKMLLFYNISPIDAYRKVKRSLDLDFSSTRSEYNFVHTETVNHASLIKEAEKTHSSNHYNGSHGYPTHNSSYMRDGRFNSDHDDSGQYDNWFMKKGM